MPNWSRFEQVFVSTFSYTNPLQEATLTAIFTSPQGESRIVDGFWDGGRIWRIRFCPDTPGQWTFTTTCSDSKNDGLGGQTGKFLCTAPIGESPFQRHGPIRVSRDRRHFEHADGTPFFWLADTVWKGARVSKPRDWQRYATIRSSQAFNVALWSVAPGDDAEYESALSGFPDKIGINPGFFQRLDAKLETLSRDGIMSAILPLAGPGEGEPSELLAKDQAILFFKYLFARWGSEPVAWLINADQQSESKDLWKALARSVLTNQGHSPVILLGGQAPDQSNARDELSWVDGYGVRASAAAEFDSAGLPASSKQSSELHEQQRPLVIFIPAENSAEPHSSARLGANQLRFVVYENLLRHAAAGVTYAGQAVADWNTEVVASSPSDVGRDLPLWEKALFMPGAKQMRPLANLMSSIEFWRLRPQVDAVALGSKSDLNQQCAVTVTKAKDLLLAYLPNGSQIDISVQAMPLSPVINWLDPRNGSTRSAAAAVTGQICQLPPPAEGDWLLIIKSGN